MTANEYRAALARLGLTQGAAARLLGVEPRTSERWACGVSAIPGPVVRLLWAIERYPRLAGQLLARRGDFRAVEGDTPPGPVEG